MAETEEKGPGPGDSGCLMCGQCCGPFFALYVELEDEIRWWKEGRADLLERLWWERDQVEWTDEGPRDRDTKEPFTRCCFLVELADGRKACGIHETKPGICRDYPPGNSVLCVLYKPP